MSPRHQHGFTVLQPSHHWVLSHSGAGGGRPSFVVSLQLKGLGPHSPGLRLSHHHWGTPRLKPENLSHGLLLSPRAAAWGPHLLPLAPVHTGAREGAATPTQGPLAHHSVTPSYQAKATAPPQGGIEAQHTGVTANHHGIKVQHTKALQATGPGKSHVGLAAGKYTAQRDLHTIQGHPLGMETEMEPALLEVLSAQEPDPTSPAQLLPLDLLAQSRDSQGRGTG